LERLIDTVKHVLKTLIKLRLSTILKVKFILMLFDFKKTYSLCMHMYIKSYFDHLATPIKYRIFRVKILNIKKQVACPLFEGNLSDFPDIDAPDSTFKQLKIILNWQWFKTLRDRLEEKRRDLQRKQDLMVRQ